MINLGCFAFTGFANLWISAFTHYLIDLFFSITDEDRSILTACPLADMMLSYLRGAPQRAFYSWHSGKGCA
jgi:hypothetical protein